MLRRDTVIVGEVGARLPVPDGSAFNFNNVHFGHLKLEVTCSGGERDLNAIHLSAGYLG
jgi:hypothetical protein